MVAIVGTVQKTKQQPRERKMEPFIFEIACVPAAKNSLYEYAHVTGCAIANTIDEAQTIILNEIISRSWIAEDVLFSDQLIALHHHEKTLYKEHHRRASQCEPPCSITMRADPKDPDGDEVQILPLPGKQNHQCS